MNKPLHLAMGMFCVVAWVLLFAAGLMVPSIAYREALMKSFTVHNFFMAGLLYTYTNVVTLTCLAGLLGGISSRLTFRDYEPQVEAGGDGNHQLVTISMAYRTENPIASMFRSFVVFLLYIAGVAIGTPGEKLFESTSPDQYARVAGLLSLTGFAVGFDPTMFSSLLSSLPSPLKRKV
ncbi:MAG: hypothetical protein EXR70_04300 [Deltaproteobacteria bacterium]|nr:hypothetical protein [Deltaproteobacteria bacterium]